MSTAGRFAAPQLLALGPPPALVTVPLNELLARTTTKLVVDMAAAGISYDVATLRSDPRFIDAQLASYRDHQRRVEFDAAIAQTFLGSATGAMLDRRAADYGVLRGVVFASDATATTEPTDERPALDWTFEIDPARWLEPDESLRLRARLAWEALSTAGPAGAYVFQALDAHPDVLDAVAYGPESGFVGPGEVLVVIQSRSSTGLPTPEIMDVIASRLDAYVVIYADGTQLVRPVRDDRSSRPLGARVTVTACRPIYYTVTATLFVRPDSDPEALRLIAIERLAAYAEQRRRIALRVSREAIITVLSLTDAAGLPVLDEVELIEADVRPDHMELPLLGAVTITVEVR